MTRSENEIKMLVDLLESGFLVRGAPELREQEGPSKWGIEPGLPAGYYLYEKVSLAEPPVAGTRYWTRPWKLKNISEGERLRLIRDRANRYDANAVEVHAPGIGKIGYVPRFAAPMVAARLDSGKRVFARARRSNTAPGTLEMRLYFYMPTKLNA
ncbi:MAG TPA: HIRAN domain-containing protein [bacterium]|nr:HIRAN domain-containing protein [bacterium]